MAQDIIQKPNSASALAEIAGRIDRSPISTESIIDAMDNWRLEIISDKSLSTLPGIAFLNLWLTQGNFRSLIERELGTEALTNDWKDNNSNFTKNFPVGLVGHWPAANVEIQPFLSFTCALLGGNASLVRIPSDLIDKCEPLIEALQALDHASEIHRRVAFVTFDSSRVDLNEGMAKLVDGAMIWGGREAIASIRALPFPPWARLAMFGPRVSAAAIDQEAWTSPDLRKTWCERFARDLWPFEQLACSSPQVIYVEDDGTQKRIEFIDALAKALERENSFHPRTTLSASLSSKIAQARASWIIEGGKARFPATPDWTILVGDNHSHVPEVVGGHTITVIFVKDLISAIQQLDGTTQTLGMAITNPELEIEIADTAASIGVDRIVKLGRMHVFDSPWDGMSLVQPMTRLVRHIKC